MKVLVVGQGMAGAVTRLLLEKYGIETKGVEMKNSHKLGCPCAWGTVRPDYVTQLQYLGMDPEKYILTESDEIVLNNDISGHINNFLTFDRQRFILDVLGRCKGEIIQEMIWRTDEGWVDHNGDFSNVIMDYGPDLVIDATGPARALLGPPTIPDRKAHCWQATVPHTADHGLVRETVYIRLFKNGYAWAFDIGDAFHIGAGAVTERPNKLPELYASQLMREQGHLKSLRVDGSCKCNRSEIRVQPLFLRDPLSIIDHEYRVIAVGEAAGCVTPFGEGNVQAITSARVLESIIAPEINTFEAGDLDPVSLHNIYNRYIARLQSTFSNYDTLYKFFDGYMRGGRWGLLKMWYHKKAVITGASRPGIEGILEKDLVPVIKDIVMKPDQLLQQKNPAAITTGEYNARIQEMRGKR